MNNSFAQLYALRCLAVGGYLSGTVLVYLASGAGGLAFLVWLLHRIAPVLGGPVGVFLAIAGIQLLTVASALSCESMGQILLKHPYEDERS
ncbi:MAG: hypothetical protein SFV17_08745 [Candidatus Obscuribacter sp.]|nr:hypothetical protein [Candidatus Obscuribacter sp.]